MRWCAVRSEHVQWCPSDGRHSGSVRVKQAFAPRERLREARPPPLGINRRRLARLQDVDADAEPTNKQISELPWPVPTASHVETVWLFLRFQKMNPGRGLTRSDRRMAGCRITSAGPRATQREPSDLLQADKNARARPA